jgi:hypothetical protein
MRALLFVVPLLLAGAGSARAGRDHCHNNEECAPYQVCTVSLGDCGSDDSPLAVCTGHCVAGRSLRAVVRVDGVIQPGSDDGTYGAGFGLELIPPFLGGHVALAGGYWTAGLFRVGPVLSWAATSGLMLALRTDVAIGDGHTGLLVGGRLEWFPWWPFHGLTPAHYFSIALEAGALDPQDADRQGFVTLGIGLWPPLPH